MYFTQILFHYQCFSCIQFLGPKQNYRLWDIIRVLVTLATFRPFKIVVLRLDHVLKSSDFFSSNSWMSKAIFLLSYGTLTEYFFLTKIIGGFFEL